MPSFSDVVTPSASSSRLTGRVKWFNTKAGYGFISVTDSSRSISDVFVHHIAISVEAHQYKYLVQGEYVEFTMINATSGPHQYQASNVVGVNGGKLMCETRYELKVSRINYKTSTNASSVNNSNVEEEPVVQPRQRSVPKETSTQRVQATSSVRARGEGPRDSDKKNWTLVQKGGENPRRASKAPRNASAAVITSESK